MAELSFFYGTMNCGKSTLALQNHHNAVAAGKHCRLFTKLDRQGGMISSRIGLAQPATLVTDDLDLRTHVGELVAGGEPVDELICDEAQFYSPAQIGQLARVVDELDVEVHAFGLLTDFTSRLFPGSQRLLELADRRQELQVQARCWCGDRGTFNARTVGGVIQRQGEQVVVGDVDDNDAPRARDDRDAPRARDDRDAPRARDDGPVAYEVLCRPHFRAGVTASTADRRPVVATTG